MSPNRAIELSDVDWRWAPWRDLPPLAPPEAPAFDLDACHKRLAKKVKLSSRGRRLDLSGAALSPGMSAEEARFWLAALVSFEHGQKPAELAKKLAASRVDVSKPPSQKAVTKAVRALGADPPRELPLLLARAIAPSMATELLLGARPETNGHDAGGTYFHGYRELVFPYLPADERAQLAARVAPLVTPAGFPTDVYASPPGAYLLAALLGVHEPLVRVVESLPRERFTHTSWNRDAYQVPQVLVFGLGSAALVDEHMRRLALVLRVPAYVRGWLAHTEDRALDLVADAIVSTKNKVAAAALADELAKVTTPACVAPMLDVLARSKAPQVAVAWLERNADLAAPMLEELGRGQGARAEAARHRLEILRRLGR